MTKFPVLPLAPSRNILIALSSGQGIQPWLMGLTEVAYGSRHLYGAMRVKPPHS